MEKSIKCCLITIRGGCKSSVMNDFGKVWPRVLRHRRRRWRCRARNGILEARPDCFGGGSLSWMPVERPAGVCILWLRIGVDVRARFVLEKVAIIDLLLNLVGRNLLRIFLIELSNIFRWLLGVVHHSVAGGGGDLLAGVHHLIARLGPMHRLWHRALLLHAAAILVLAAAALLRPQAIVELAEAVARLDRIVVHRGLEETVGGHVLDLLVGLADQLTHARHLANVVQLS